MEIYDIEMNENVCRFNKLIDCKSRACGSCGWNPPVAEQRIIDWHRKRYGKNIVRLTTT